MPTLLYAALLCPVPSLAAGQLTGDDPLMDEIVITARKVPERPLDVPMSVQVLDGAFLDNADLSRVFELQFGVPGLVVNSLGGFGGGFALRGVTDQGGTSVSVATHLDGVYLGATTLALTRLFDLERVEILKGPQGTLYGRNATGGSMNFLSRGPEDEFGAAAEAAWGSFRTARLQGHLNLPFERSAVRLAFIGSAGDGYIRNSVDARRFGENDFLGLRAGWRFSPSEALRLDVRAQTVVDDGAAGEVWTPNPAFLPDPADIRLTRVTHPDPFLEIRSDIASANLGLDLGFARLAAVTGYARAETRNRDDCAGLPFLLDCVRELLPDEHRQLSQEIRLVAPAGARFEWLLGAYFYSADASTRYFQVAPLLDPLPSRDSNSTSAENAHAFFGQLSVPAGNRWQLTGGLRLSRDDRRVTSIGTGFDDNQAMAIAANDWTRLSWRTDVEYEAGDNIRVYGGVATGFKSGGVTTERLSNGEFDTFDAEDLTAYEAGIKIRGDAARFEFDAAVFYYDFADLQVATTFFDGARVITDIDNAAEARIVGADLSGSVHLGYGWELSGGLVWLPQREFTNFQAASGTVDLAGNEISRSPEWTTTVAISFRRPLAGTGILHARLEHSYRSAYFFTKENNPIYAQAGFGLLNASLRYAAADESWYLFAAARNITAADYFNQVFIQSSPGYPDTLEIGFGLHY
ncbi:MAG: TonB-dependent receptor [Woeseiaceae bacterium]|nr:TonB-dependent receptor [Woeseiaceae bacterium]